MKIQNQDRSNAFLRNWVGSMIVSWPISMLLCLMLYGIVWLMVESFGFALAKFLSPAATNTLIMMVVGLVPGMAIGFAVGEQQQRLLRDYFQIQLTGWMRNSVIAGMVGGVLVVQIALFIDLQHLVAYWEMGAIPLFVLALAIGQTIQLRHYTHQAWIWLLANTVSAIVFVGLMNMNQPAQSLYGLYVALQLGLWFLAAFVQSTITGIVMLWLMDRRKEDDGDLQPAPVYVEVFNHPPHDRQ